MHNPSIERTLIKLRFLSPLQVSPRAIFHFHAGDIPGNWASAARSTSEGGSSWSPRVTMRLPVVAKLKHAERIPFRPGRFGGWRRVHNALTENRP